MASTLSLLFLVLLLPLLSHSQSVPPAMFIFGDSTVDAGNNDVLPTRARANHNPYGMSFPGGVATGRFTNGKTIPDFIAEKLGLPLVPAYRLARSYARGANFASASSGILPRTHIGGALPMDLQVTDFERVANMMHYALGRSRASKFLANSIVYISVGNNDVNNFFRDSNNQDLSSLPEDFQAELLSRFEQQITRMYKAGARKFVVVGLSAVGCIPMNQKDGTCDANANQISVKFNSALDEMLQGLQTKFTRVIITKPDFYGLMVETIQNAADYGFINTSEGCCEVGVFCALNSPTCELPDTYMYFDAIHQTESFYKIAAERWWSGKEEDISPVNIRELAMAY